jgi:hypothetical protein
MAPRNSFGPPPGWSPLEYEAAKDATIFLNGVAAFVFFSPDIFADEEEEGKMNFLVVFEDSRDNPPLFWDRSWTCLD